MVEIDQLQQIEVEGLNHSQITLSMILRLLYWERILQVSRRKMSNWETQWERWLMTTLSNLSSEMRQSIDLRWLHHQKVPSNLKTNWGKKLRSSHMRIDVSRINWGTLTEMSVAKIRCKMKLTDSNAQSKTKIGNLIDNLLTKRMNGQTFTENKSKQSKN